MKKVIDILTDEFWRWLKYIKIHCRRFLIVLLVFIPCLLSLKLFSINGTINPENVEEQMILILGISIQNWATWLTIITLPIGAFWAMLQYDKNIAITRQEKAYEIVMIFTNELFEKMDIINNIYEKYEPLKKIYEKFEKEK